MSRGRATWDQIRTHPPTARLFRGGKERVTPLGTLRKALLGWEGSWVGSVVCWLSPRPRLGLHHGGHLLLDSALKTPQGWSYTLVTTTLWDRYYFPTFCKKSNRDTKQWWSLCLNLVLWEQACFIIFLLYLLFFYYILYCPPPTSSPGSIFKNTNGQAVCPEILINLAQQACAWCQAFPDDSEPQSGGLMVTVAEPEGLQCPSQPQDPLMLWFYLLYKGCFARALLGSSNSTSLS